MSHQSVFSGIVKQVLSGDTIVIRDRPVDGPPPERTIVLSNISCGRVARRPTPNNPNSGPEDPFAWQAREFVRSKLIGREVCYTIETELPSGRKYGSVFIGKSTNGENIALLLLEEGLAELRKLNAVAAEKNPVYQQLMVAEELAKSSQKGRWSTDALDAVREVIWSLDEPRTFVDKYKGKRLHGVVEYVRDGSTMQITLLPDTLDEGTVFYNIMLSLSGIKAPAVRFEDGKQVAEPFGLDAQFFVESRLLQRDVMVLLESTNNQNFIGTVLHPNGNISEVLLREGLARCIDWNLNLVSVPGATDAYRTAERSAKERRLRLWIDYQPPQGVTAEVQQARDPNSLCPGMSFSGHVAEVGNGDNVTVKCSDGVYRKFFLSSVRAPRLASAPREGEDSTPVDQRARVRPLYDVPFLFEAREQLRGFVGKPVTVHIDYIQPKLPTTTDERACATIRCGPENLAESLVSKGLANVIRYRNANDNRSGCYADLLAAEEDAQTKGLGIHSKSERPVHRVADLTGNLAKSRQFLPFLQSNPRTEGIVEFVVHASRLRVYLPRETCLNTLLLAGIQCPRRGRPKPDGTQEPDMPFSEEGYQFTKDLCMQRNVEVTIETIDRVGNFVGWCFLETSDGESKQTTEGQKSGKKKKKGGDTSSGKPKVNLSVLLVAHGFATVHRAPSTENSPYYQELVRAEEAAKSAKQGLWSSDEFVKQWEAEANAYDADETPSAESDIILPGGVTKGYVDDFSLLNINGHESGKEAPKLDWKPVQFTAFSRPIGSEGLRFFAQHLSDSSTIMQISRGLNSQPIPVVPGYQPQKGEIFAASFSADNCWYRARGMRRSAKSVIVQYIDFGNEESIDVEDLPARTAPLPPGPFKNIPPQAHEYRLAFVQLSPEATEKTVTERIFAKYVMEKEVLLAVQYEHIPCGYETLKPVPAVALRVPPGSGSTAGSSAYTGKGEGEEVAELLLEEGLVCVEPMSPQLIRQLPHTNVRTYLEAQARAKKERKNIWCYGDFRVDNSQQ
ncbi:Staphylococcal nuclease domain-containing protein 1 [Fasciola hepatica]|uniref:Staphylococcal nuclease domain-containing protein 1 n=1 Tax=Fasciola hepatica TaxID=6192 RepID=A0A4E0RBW5_FASHE|nr:Staphylococcal nuclease domain-containing protein 1 [Fasciola hepatica]